MSNPPHDPYILEQQNQRLKTRLELVERENDELRERLAIVKGGDLRSMETLLSIAFSLTPYEARFVYILLKSDIARHDALYRDLCTEYLTEEPPDVGVLKVRISHIRGKLKKHGIGVCTQWGVGYYIDPLNKQKIRDALTAFKTAMSWA